MPTLIEGGIALAAVAKTMKTNAADLERQCRQMNVFVGVTWSGQPAISEYEAYELVTGRPRAETDHSRAWREYAGTFVRPR